MAKIIIIDDEPGILQVMRKLSERMGHETSAYQSGKDGMLAIQRVVPDVVVVDLRIGDMSGLEIIQRCNAQFPHIAIIMVTGYGTVESAVEAMKLGAFDYLTKPFELDDLQRTINRALNQREPAARTAAAGLVSDSEAEPALVSSRLIGESQRMKEIHGIIEKIADYDSPILLEGEFGSGKQMVARAIHNRSKRNASPFKVLDCSSLPEDLLEMELFGSPGGRGETIFRRAMGGTVFLEEVNLLPHRLQSVLEGYLEDVTARRMNNSLAESMDVRFVASTNKPLEDEVAAGRFREDLYYKVSVIPINVPSLRNRQSDIPLLVEYFLERYAAMNKRAKPNVDKYALELLESYKWPGNVSELQNTVERASAFCDDNRIRPVDLPSKISQRVEITDDENEAIVHHLPIGNSLSDFIRKQEKVFIRETLKFNDGSREKTASMLDVSIATLYRKMGLKLERDKMLSA
ncbi:MAG: two-component system, NtrC family, response regulator AtoC [Verrucomicrobia bacterium]|nr:MAG: two-component system, NtrC family, response regulator AtoC [Verrucomicrobiota bacterium]